MKNAITRHRNEEVYALIRQLSYVVNNTNKPHSIYRTSKLSTYRKMKAPEQE